MCQNLHNILKQFKIDNDILGRFILLALCVLEVWDSTSLFSQHFFCLITVVYWRLIRGNSSYAKQLLNFHITSLLSHLLQSWIADCHGLYIYLFHIVLLLRMILLELPSFTRDLDSQRSFSCLRKIEGRIIDKW